ncbi:phenylacetate--CoA ligase family protein [Paenibacillus lentus]|uniref:Phenylacetate--CoA ligase family protein n=1 Tax=Paenibacillus lentus TaxID=1338368 RepID=A0A3S8S0J5_9BACL|nr:phenylacetate--CoA ligase family protein [Paenibacillus lentus]AZK48675.1 phenylacetate--CoA ligase family protein [Paenibacillus lentus]
MALPPSLQQHLSHIIQLHPAYGDLLAEQGILPHAAVLSELPLLTEERLNKIYYKQEPRTKTGLTVYRTSGTSTGIRKSIYYSPEDEEHYRLDKIACYRAWLASNSEQIHRAFADVGTGHAASTANTIFGELGMQTESISFSMPIEEHISRINAFKPDLLYTMPSILEAIARAAGNPVSLGIRKIVLVGEMATSAWQANMAARFGIEAHDILDTYGSIEVGAIASYSHPHGVYLFADGIHAETVPAEQLDPHFEPLEEGEGVLVLTSSRRSLFPVIRYVTYDVVRGFRTVEIDGVMRQAFTCISKRIGSELKHGEKISLYDIENVVHTFVKDAELRVSVRDNKLTVHIRSKSLNNELLASIRHAIEHTIEAIGKMIEGRMLDRIEVIRVKEDESFDLGQSSVKSKKLYN